MSEVNWFVRHQEVIEFIMKYEDQKRQIELQEAWDDLQAVPSYVEQQAQAWAAELALPVEQ